MQHIINSYKKTLANFFETIDPQVLQNVAAKINNGFINNQNFFCFGNGGSSSTSQHFANDLLTLRRKHAGSQSLILDLTSNSAIITALSNDSSFDNILYEQIRQPLKTGDTVIIYSVSGNSQNIIKSLQLIKERGAILISFTGFDGGILKKLSDFNIHIEGIPGAYGTPEGTHLLISHMVIDIASEILASEYK